jgi:hypothetical protein
MPGHQTTNYLPTVQWLIRSEMRSGHHQRIMGSREMQSIIRHMSIWNNLHMGAVRAYACLCPGRKVYQ